ncbi:hypothetical protein HYALB_00013513 [Hymenoscyphus albidus]|uniref:Uncharacterized protein n=1 Tax=Hymenoscyphus albidus TaxID=595503 RepID=A0A9N9LWW2_9HELO|nr:hypothetical protein HYALB_00013513 [Hymenoscyphus albidus]
MRFSTFSLLALGALSSGVTARSGHYFGYCLDKNNNGLLTVYNAAKTQNACNIHRTQVVDGVQCPDCEYRDDPNKKDDERCYSPGGKLDPFTWDKICIIRADAAGSATSD